MNQKAQTILDKFILGESLSAFELKELKRIFADNIHREEISLWLINNWDAAQSDDIEISYDKLKQKINEYEDQKRISFTWYDYVVNFSHYYQRIAAVLFIPLIFGISLYFFYTSAGDENFYTAEAPLGQKAKVELPDGSTVWLNSGSNIRYSSNFNKKNRSIELNGEAFFEVKKNTGKPFFVLTPFLDVKVTGTRFNVNAYDDEPFIETSLLDGKVNVILKGASKPFQLSPGNVIVYSKLSHAISTSKLDEDVATGWKDNRLIFINDDFYKLTRKIEKWYNVDVVYNPEQFKYNKLTVKLLEGEQLNRLLEIIETAVGAKCTVKENKIYIVKTIK
ncbi:MAG: FecR family protein [Ignavibacteria bacterium]|nr:FecR family protein [Ignavibacteria bacterium]